MATSDTTRALWQIHLCVLLWGFTAILGKLISMPALPLVWWRMLIVVAALALLPRVWRGLRALPARTRWAYAGIGALVALHWLTFYGAIKLSNASVAATCIAFATPITALVEPLLTRQRFQPRDLALGVLSLPGIWLVVGGVPAGMHAGIVAGVASACLVALFGSLNKRMVDAGDPLTVTALELGAGTLVLTLLAPLMPLLKLGVASPLGSGNQIWPWISLPDEVRAFTWLIDHPIAGPVNLAAPVTTTNAELIRALAHAMRRTTFPISVPVWAMRLVVGEFAERAVDSQDQVPQVLLDSGFEFEHRTLDELAAWFVAKEDQDGR